jgi:glutathione S-transferase
VLELYQTEWCPASRRIRQRLTELAIDFVARQVPVERAERSQLLAATGSDTIPVLVLENGHPLLGEAEIAAHLEHGFSEPPGAEAHRLKAEKVRRRELERAT